MGYILMIIDLLRFTILALLLAMVSGCSHLPSDELTNEESAARQLVAANAGDGEAAYNVAVFYYSGGVGLPKDWDQARYWFARAAELGNTEAQCHLGGEYEDGELFENDIPRAQYWFEQCMLSVTCPPPALPI